ncbi:MAG: cellulase family glycosylhydrolase [Armatimonadetes bacterium]|nr:cellulase family glycosylhydrolase [Armatimonadota bacterium]
MRTEWLAFVYLLTARAAAAAEWREVRTPPTRREPAQLYQFVRGLDPLDDATRWVGASHDQSAKSAVTQGEGRQPGQAALRVSYEFTGRDGLEYVDVQGKVPLPDDATALGLWMRGGEQALPCRIRVLDAGGECYQYDLGTLVPGQWRLGITQIQAGHHWGGDGNGRLDPPLTLVSILFDKLGSPYQAVGEATVAELAVYRQSPERLMPHGLKVSVPEDRAYLVYEPGEPVHLQVAADAEVTLPAQVTARLVDPFGTVVTESTVSLGADSPTPLTLTPQPGAYDLQLRLAGREDDLDAPWADFRFAVLPPSAPGGDDSPYGVSTHFGQGWPLEIMPLIARAGITFYRDEISWNAVEREKDQLAIPDFCRQYIRRGTELGLRPLIIADYANQHYDDYAFPVSPEARAGFARYAGFLSSELKPDLRHLEVWNEWCGGCGMGGKQGRAEDYGPTYLQAARAIREANPEAVVCGIGGEWGSDPLPAMMAGGAGAAMDAFSVHPYHYPQLPGQWLRDHLRRASDTAQQAAGRRVPLWITEIGWPTHMGSNASSFVHQARSLVRTIVIAQAAGTEKLFWYDFKDDGGELTYNEHNFGLVHHQDFTLAPKPAYVAYAHLISLLKGRRLVTQGVSEGGLWRTVYEGGGGKVTVAWAAEESQRFTVPVPRGARVEDMFGRPVATDGRLEVTWNPVFVVSN